jgi:hypothetical protein
MCTKKNPPNQEMSNLNNYKEFNLAKYIQESVLSTSFNDY